MAQHRREPPPQDHEEFKREMEQGVQDIQRRYLENQISLRQRLIDTYTEEKSHLQSVLDSLSTPTKDPKQISKSRRKSSRNSTGRSATSSTDE